MTAAILNRADPYSYARVPEVFATLVGLPLEVPLTARRAIAVPVGETVEFSANTLGAGVAYELAGSAEEVRAHFSGTRLTCHARGAYLVRIAISPSSDVEALPPFFFAEVAVAALAPEDYRPLGFAAAEFIHERHLAAQAKVARLSFDELSRMFADRPRPGTLPW